MLHEDTVMSVEDVQDFVEEFLMDSTRKDVAKAYVRYRYKREIMRQTEKTYDGILELVELNNQELKDENSNKNATIASTQRDYMAGEVSKDLSQRYFLPKAVVDAHNNGEIHFHDMDYYAQHIHNCADENMWIKIKKGNEIRTIQLKDLGQEIGLEDNQIANLENSSYLILSRDGWTKLKAVSKRKGNLGEKLFTIKTRTGLPLKITENHRLPVIRNNEEQVLFAKDIQIGDSLINIENLQLSANELNDNFLDLTKLNNNDLDLRIINISALKGYLKYKYKVIYSDYAKAHNFYNPKGKMMTLKEFNILINDYPLSFDILSQLRIKCRGSKHDYPLHIPFTSELAKLYGYIYADGGVYVNPEQSLYQLGFYNTNEQIVDDFLNCYENVFGYKMNKSYPTEKSTSPCIRVVDGSKLIVAIFKDFAGAYKRDVANISIPDFIMNGSEKIKYAFLSACIDTDGCLSTAITYNTCGDKYSDQLILLLQGLGYHPHKTIDSKIGSVYKVYKITGIRKHNNYKVSITRTDEMAILQSHLTGYKYNDEYAYRGLNTLFNEEKIFSITYEEDFKSSVYDLETESHWFILNNYVSHNCCLVNLDDMLQNGTVINQTMIEKPHSFLTACTIATQIMAVVASGQYGGQSISLEHLAPFVDISRQKIKEEVEYEIECSSGNPELIDEIVHRRLCDEIKKGVQTMQYQINTLNTSNG